MASIVGKHFAIRLKNQGGNRFSGVPVEGLPNRCFGVVAKRRNNGRHAVVQQIVRDFAVRNGFSDIKVTYDIDADATPDEIKALVAQSQKRSAVYDIITNPTDVRVEVV